MVTALWTVGGILVGYAARHFQPQWLPWVLKKWNDTVTKSPPEKK